MNAPDVFFLPDTQASHDHRNIPINRVGVKNVTYPVRIGGAGGDSQPTIARFDMTVALPGHAKGTHMSRFLEILEGFAEDYGAETMPRLLETMVDHLDAEEGRVDMHFPYFMRKSAPVSGVESLLDYQVTLSGEFAAGVFLTTIRVTVPVTSLCPCSKAISEYGAHNQRSHVTIEVKLRAAMEIRELIQIAEREASCELYGLLKRPDEKYVTERAYDNPKFVEDLVRDIAAALDADERVVAFLVESENFESIHNHSAYARIERNKQH